MGVGARHIWDEQAESDSSADDSDQDDWVGNEGAELFQIDLEGDVPTRQSSSSSERQPEPRATESNTPHRKWWAQTCDEIHSVPWEQTKLELERLSRQRAIHKWNFRGSSCGRGDKTLAKMDTNFHSKIAKHGRPGRSRSWADIDSPSFGRYKGSSSAAAASVRSRNDGKPSRYPEFGGIEQASLQLAGAPIVGATQPSEEGQKTRSSGSSTSPGELGPLVVRKRPRVASGSRKTLVRDALNQGLFSRASQKLQMSEVDRADDNAYDADSESELPQSEMPFDTPILEKCWRCGRTANPDRQRGVPVSSKSKERVSLLSPFDLDGSQTPAKPHLPPRTGPIWIGPEP
ncbi:hypothetical protein NA57DRAFT_55848 [Rhizodiscina lignyota]|uniref:Uncharacterized protein n=1 Tax=Rhizodiscina lignyota TaxID=1504668 RepID=A0A9P4IIJ1_9PEZI|nr:hypothetical protein NA57DRAFT_55848 [Rhizodiscina lignyota]